MDSNFQHRLENDHLFRRALAKDFTWFCRIYLAHYLQLEPANFHYELTDNLGDHSINRLLVIGFRGSAKSTFGSLALIIWAALEHPDKYPFILPIADTGTQAALNIANIKTELDTNKKIRQDYGMIEYARNHMPVPDPTFETEDEWQAKNMVLANGVRILARSRGQKIRGFRHLQHRPKLVVVDDPEDTKWVKTKENRNTTDRWMRGEVLGAIDETEGRLVVIGNWLHEDALLARLKKITSFKVLEYPLIKEIDGRQFVTWSAKYPTQASLDAKREEMTEVAWMREMLLKIVPEEGAEVVPDDIHYYDEMPEGHGIHGHGLDLAISTKETADYTAMVTGVLRYVGTTPNIYIQPNPLNARLDFGNTMKYCIGVAHTKGSHMFYVEDVAYQKVVIEEMMREMLSVTPMQPISDKRSRLRVAARYIKNGSVKFPRKGCEELLQQLFNFGSETHDDMVDALVYAILGMVGNGLGISKVVILK